MSPGPRLRPARAEDSELLGELALRSKGHWGYDRPFLERVRAELTIDAGRMERETVVVAVRDAEVVGFYALDGEGEVGELVDLFVEPEAMGTGVGGALLTHALEAARKAGRTRMRIESDPYARTFYERYGARQVGEAPSGSIPGRMLPLLQIDL